MKYDYDKKAAAAKAESDKKQLLASAALHHAQFVRNGTITFAVILLCSGIAIFFFYKRKRDADEARKEAELKAQVAETEMKVLRAQMNPHFIFNSLNSISYYISKNELMAADKYLSKFTDLMRLILENSEHKEVTLKDDLDALEWYIQLEELRMSQRFTHTIVVSGDIDKESTMVPPLILQPFVENSIWHGLVDKETGGMIKIDIHLEQNMLCCVVEDNGIGSIAASKAKESSIRPRKKKSLGMKITQSRIDLLNKQRKSNGSIKIFDLEPGVRAEIRLPLIIEN